MKKILAAAMLALAIPCVAMAAKPVNSQKLLDDPGRFAVVYVSDDERVYADAPANSNIRSVRLLL